MRASLAIALVFGACGGSSRPAPATPSSSATSADAVASTSDYVSRNEHIAGVMSDVFQSDNCDEIAADLTKFLSDHRDELDVLRAWEKAHPDDEHAFDAGHHDQLKAMQDRMGVVAVKCKPNAAFQSAIASVPE